MKIETTPLEAMEKLVSRIKYKPGWEFRAQHKVEFNIISVGVCLSTIEQHPAQRADQEREREAWERQQRTGYFEWEARSYERQYRPMPLAEPKTMVWREIPFQIPDIALLDEMLIVAQIWELVILIEAHEIKEFFRVDGLCVQEPHPESPRELAFDGALDRWDFIPDLLGGKRHGGFDNDYDPRAVEEGSRDSV